MASEFIFVYGTLRKETATSMYRVLARYCEYFSEGYIQGRLYEIDSYPGVIESDNPNERVKGELYRLNDCKHVLSQLDEYEECSDAYPQPHEYVRKQVLVSLEGGGSVMAWVYIYNKDVSSHQLIESGDYLEFYSANIERNTLTKPSKRTP